MSNKLKENTRIKSTIILLTTIVLITFISIIVIKLNTYINRNPYLDEINEIIQQKYGEDFWIDNNCTKDDKISEITSTLYSVSFDTLPPVCPDLHCSAPLENSFPDRKSTRLNSSHCLLSRMPSSA